MKLRAEQSGELRIKFKCQIVLCRVKLENSADHAKMLYASRYLYLFSGGSFGCLCRGSLEAEVMNLQPCRYVTERVISPLGYWAMAQRRSNPFRKSCMILGEVRVASGVLGCLGAWVLGCFIAESECAAGAVSGMPAASFRSRRDGN
jgi:hypothetical protein